MASRTVKVILDADVSGLSAKMRAAAGSVREFAANSDKYLKDNAQSIATVSSGLLKIGTVGLAAVGLAVKKFADFDSAMSSVQAATMESADNMELLRAAAISAGADTQYSATEAAGAIEALAKAGVSTADILNGGLAGALDLAASGQIDVAQAAEIAATSMNQFGLKGSDMSHIADLLAAAAGKAMGEVTDMAQAFKYVGPVASQMGISIEETAGSIAYLAQQGVLGDQAGTSLRGMLSSLTSPSKIASKTMEELGINVYDASGKFIGFRGVAEQLKTSMSGLTNAERDQALGRIFGNEQITTARILYQGGAAAIDEWTDSVNDSGFAAEQAALKTDNLKGDIERLGGSLETAFIKSASGANGVLRTLVQGSETAVDLFGDLPSPIQQGALALTAFGSAGALAAGAGMKAVVSFVEMKNAMRELNMSIPVLSTLAQSVSLTRTSLSQGKASAAEFGQAFTLARSLGETNLSALSTASQVSMGSIKSAASGVGSALLGAFGGPVGIAVTGLTVLIGLYAKGQAEAAQFTKALTATLDEQTGALTDSSRAAVAKQLQDKGVLDDARDLGISLDTVTQAAMGNSKAMEELAHKSGEVSNDALNNNLIPSLDSNYRKMQNVESVTKATADQVEASKSAWDNQSDAVDGSTDSQDANAASTDVATAAIENQAQSLQDLLDIQKEAAGVAMDFDEAQGAWAQQIDDNAEAVKKLTGYVDENGNAVEGLGTAVTDSKDAWDLHTEAGRLANDTMLDTSKQAWNLIDSLKAQNASEADLRASMQTSRDEFIKTATQMGMNETAAKALADRYGLIPSRVTTTVNAVTDDARRKIDAVIAQIASLPLHKTVTVEALTYATTYAQTIYSASGPSGSGNALHRGKAAGGPIYGPGTGTSDTAGLFALSNGEHVLTAAEVAGAGGQSAIYALRAAVRRDGADAVRRAIGAPGYASGGAVPREARVTPSYMSQPSVNVSAPSLEGLALTGSLNINGALVPLVDARIERQQKRFARGPR